MSANPAPANADFTERLQRIRDGRGQGLLMADQSIQQPLARKQPVRLSRAQELLQNVCYAASGLGIVAAGAVTLLLYTQSADPQAAAAKICPPAPVEAAIMAAASTGLPQFGTHKITGRKVLHPEAAAPGC